MSKQLFITQHDEVKTSAALFDGNRLVNYFTESSNTSSKVGSIFRGKVRRVVPSMQAIFVDIGLSEPGFLAARDAGKLAKKNDSVLNEIFREGQIIWVKVIKDVAQSIEGLESKGLRLTTELTIDTPYLVYLPNSHVIRLSKKIKEDLRKQQFKERLQKLVNEQQIKGGFIVRSNVNVAQNSSWLQDAEILWSRWQKIKQSMQQSKKVGLIHQSPSLVKRLQEVIVAEQIVNVTGVVSAQLLFENNIDSFNVLSKSQLTEKLNDLRFKEQLNQAMTEIVKLPEGGSIVIERTEALIAIDVNMGSAIQNFSSILELNLVAAKVIAEQLRLRNLSGMIIVDFINMATKNERDILLQKLNQLFSEDAVRIDVYGYTQLGLIELSRERIYPCLTL